MKNSAYTHWQSKRTKAISGHDPQRIKAQHKAGKLTARTRIEQLLDADSFEEVQQLATSNFLKNPTYTDGVITGFGRVNGQQVALYAQDFTIKGGSLGKRHAEKICSIMDMAAKIGCPIIGIIDSGGARIDEGIHALAGYGDIFMRNVRYSGVVPQISMILGPCAGGASYSPALTDFVFVADTISNMFITGPQVIEQVMHEKIGKEELGGADVHSSRSGVAHVRCSDELDMFTRVKQLLALLPANYLTTQEPVHTETTSTTSVSSLVPEDFNKSYDMKTVIQATADDGTFFEIHEFFAPNIITAFTRIDGMTVGVVANQPMCKAGTIDIDASVKAARFINFCNSFDIPLLSLVDVPGYLPGVEQEHNGIIRHGAKLLQAYAQATIPKITIILRKAFGGAYIVMGSKQLGADFTLAWPQAQIAVLGAQAGVTILHGKKIQQLPEEEQAAARTAHEEAYTQEHLNPFTAAEQGYIDAIIEPDNTRTHIVSALRIATNKVEQLPKKKQPNILL